MKYIITLLALVSCAIAQNNTGVLMIDTLRPKGSADTFPIVLANEIQGGPFTATNLAGLSNIPTDRLVVGAIGYAESTGLYYRLTSTSPVTWSSINGANFTNISSSNVIGVLTTNGSAAGLTNFPTLNQNTTGTASNVTGVVAIANGGTGATNAGGARTNIGLGATNAVAFSGIYNSGNFTNLSGTIYGLKTNVGPFEGIGNFLASNNTTLSNETLFRVGVAEETNRSAQFGFRIARTNNGGEGFAVFSVYGYNALMMIGPSDRSRSNSITNTNAGIEADIWTISPTNRVMTLQDTNTGAMTMHRPIGFNTNNSNVLTTPPSNTTVTNPTGWIQIYVGTNSVRIPYYQ